MDLHNPIDLDGKPTNSRSRYLRVLEIPSREKKRGRCYGSTRRTRTSPHTYSLTDWNSGSQRIRTWISAGGRYWHTIDISWNHSWRQFTEELTNTYFENRQQDRTRRMIHKIARSQIEMLQIIFVKLRFPQLKYQQIAASWRYAWESGN